MLAGVVHKNVQKLNMGRVPRPHSTDYLVLFLLRQGGNSRHSSCERSTENNMGIDEKRTLIEVLHLPRQDLTQEEIEACFWL